LDFREADPVGARDFRGVYASSSSISLSLLLSLSPTDSIQTHLTTAISTAGDVSQ
jgi:hypothetical protein